MRYIAQGLAQAGYTVHVSRLAGHCGSVEDLMCTRWADWYESVEDEHRLIREKCDTVVVGGLSMGAILALHHAARHPQDVSALALYAPPLWLDGWSVPWYSSVFRLLTQKWLADYIVERDPWGIGDSRSRALVEKAITGGDGSQVGAPAVPGSLIPELRWLLRCVQREVGHVRQSALIVHPRSDDRATLRNLDYLQSNLGGLTQTVVLDEPHTVPRDRQCQLLLDRTLEFVVQLGQKTPNPIDREDVLSPIEKEDILDWLHGR
jgi:carboxylesterase